MYNINQSEDQINKLEYNINFLNEVASDFSEVLKKSHEISIDDILKKICVSPPYFAFKKIHQYEDILIAQVDREQQLGNEVTQMAIGEICRHAAILGTCSASLNQTEKFYYLAKIGKANLIDNSFTTNENIKKTLCCNEMQ